MKKRLGDAIGNLGLLVLKFGAKISREFILLEKNDSPVMAEARKNVISTSV